LGLFFSLYLLEPEMFARKASIAVVPVLGLVFATGALGLDSFLAMILHCCCAIYIEKKVRISIFSLERKM